MEDLAALAEKAKAGDADAYARLYAETYRDMYRFAWYILGHREDAEDAVAETATEAFRQIRSLRDAESFRAWIFRILQNICRRTLKSYTLKTAGLDESLPAEEVDLTGNEAVRERFRHLSDDERCIISMHVFAGYTTREIAALLGMNESTVRSKENRALKRLREQEG
jgi:RNA polymerase sigma factor (sigma-70 family)